MSGELKLLAGALVWVVAANGQSTSPSVSQVLMYSATTPNLTVQSLTGPSFNLPQAVPGIYSETAVAANSSNSNFTGIVENAANYSVSRSFVQLTSVFNASIATALSIVPLSSPASGVIDRRDPASGAMLPEDSTLGPIFTERAETIGKGKFYIGFSNQDFHFTKYNGTSLNALNVLYTGGNSANVVLNGSAVTTVPATFSIGMDVRLSQDITFLTYGVTDKLDISVGLPVVHAAVAARTYDGEIYAGNGFATNNSACWCANTFSPGYPSLILPQIGVSSLGKTGFGDLLVRAKGTVLKRKQAIVAVGGDVRFPTGDAQNYLGVGTTTVKPFAAVSLYSKPLAGGIVVSPHFDVGWQFSGKSILGGPLEAAALSQSTSAGTINYIGAPFTTSKDYLPDVFTWAGGAEVALGRHNTVVADILGNEVGLIHGIPNATTQTLSGVYLPTGPNGDDTGVAVPTKGSAAGLVPVGQISFGQYYASLGYKARIVGNLVANINLLIRLDNNGLVAPFVPLFGLGYSF
jgi:hypothetical protein